MSGLLEAVATSVRAGADDAVVTAEVLAINGTPTEKGFVGKTADFVNGPVTKTAKILFYTYLGGTEVEYEENCWLGENSGRYLVHK